MKVPPGVEAAIQRAREAIPPDINFGWQKQRDALAQLIATCAHPGEPLLNADDVPYCPDCGRHLNP